MEINNKIILSAANHVYRADPMGDSWNRIN